MASQGNVLLPASVPGRAGPRPADPSAARGARWPPVETPPAFKEAEGWKIAEPRDNVPRGRWWERFGDADLNALVSQVEMSNFSLQAAEARVRQATALTQAARAAYFPTFTGTAGATRGSAGSSGSITTTGSIPTLGDQVNSNGRVDVTGANSQWIDGGVLLTIGKSGENV